jgi:glycerol dehydrogenase-like iron-containing ADH family enzyme
MRLLARYAARFVAQTLAGIGTGALLDLATWRALLMGLAANIIPAAVTLLETYASTGTVEVPE